MSGALNTNGAPTAEQIWGNYNIDSWTHSQRSWFQIWIEGAAANLLFAEQSVIDRVTKEVSDIIRLAKSGELSADEAIAKIRFKNLFSDDEREMMNQAAKELGPVITNKGGTS